MPKRKMPFDNTPFLHNVEGNIGNVEYIGVYRQNRPKGLRKPYEYILGTKDCKALLEELKFLKAYEKEDKFQFSGVTKKSVSKGIRFDLFLLAYKKGLCGVEKEGTSEAEWNEVCEKVQQILFKYLGEDALMYAEPYSDDDKFQARFETYIMYKELTED